MGAPQLTLRLSGSNERMNISGRRAVIISAVIERPSAGEPFGTGLWDQRP
ncbi:MULTISPECIES: hypothetical protein [unclassified Kribbella]